jgi:uncharacterized protein (TIGR02453 family)
MTNPLTSDLLQYLGELSLNNNRDWFQANKSRYEKVAKAPFLELVGMLLDHAHAVGGMEGLPDDPKSCVFRINRDVRFSKDKRPYKENLAALIGIGGTKSKELPGFYFHIGLEGVWIGGGAYFMEPATLKQVRQFFSEQPAKLSEALDDAAFKKYFGNLQGEKNKRLDAEFQQAAETQPLLYNKQLFFSEELPVEQVLDTAFVDQLTTLYDASLHMNLTLLQAMTTRP